LNKKLNFEETDVVGAWRLVAVRLRFFILAALKFFENFSENGFKRPLSSQVQKSFQHHFFTN
jgi:hypothetical protein